MDLIERVKFLFYLEQYINRMKSHTGFLFWIKGYKAVLDLYRMLWIAGWCQLTLLWWFSKVHIDCIVSKQDYKNYSPKLICFTKQISFDRLAATSFPHGVRETSC